MGVRVRNYPQSSENYEGNPIFDDSSFEQRVTIVDGQEFHWAPNQVRNFTDEGVGAAHAAFFGGATIVQEDTIPFRSSRF